MALIQVEAQISIGQILAAVEQFTLQEVDELVGALLRFRVENYGAFSPSLIAETQRLSMEKTGHKNLADLAQGWEEEASDLAEELDRLVQERHQESL